MSRQHRGEEDADVIAFADRDRDPLVDLGIITRDGAVADLRRMQTLPRYETPFESLTKGLGMGWYGGQVRLYWRDAVYCDPLCGARAAKMVPLKT